MCKNLRDNISIELNMSDCEILFETMNASICQSDSLEKYLMSFQGEVITFRACELISFRRKIQNIDLTQLLESDTPDVEFINMPHCDRFFVLTIFEILELKELLTGAFAMLELNSLIHKEIVRKGVH